MSLKALLDSVDGLPDEVKQHYVEKNGKFQLDVESVGDFALENITGLKNALTSERDRVREVTDQLSAFKGLDPKKAREALEKVKDIKDPPDLEKVRKDLETQLRTDYEKKLKAIENDRDDVTTQLEGVMVMAEAVKAIADKKGSVDLLLPHVQSQTRIQRNDQNKFFLQVYDPITGRPREVVKDGQLIPLSVGELVGQMSEDEKFERAFQGSGARGSGAEGVDVRRTGTGHVISALDAKDPQKYRRAKAAAEKAGMELEIAET